MLPYFSWSDIKTLLLLLPHCKWRDSEDNTWLNFVWSLLLRDNYSLTANPSPNKATKSTPRKQGRKSSIVLSAMTALATLSAPAPFQLSSDVQLRRALTRYKDPLGGLNTNKLSLSTAKSSPHKALLTQLHNNDVEFKGCLKLDLPGMDLPIYYAIIDS